MTSFLGAHKIRQESSHVRLLRKATVPRCQPGRKHQNKFDAIIVPAARPASSFSDLVDLSARLETRLVVLCSKQSRIEQIADRVAGTPGAKALLIDVPTGYQVPGTPTRTARFVHASAGRSSDLSTKRNLGLLLARLNGWTKILFLDDDITLTQTGRFQRLARQLEQNQIAGMVCRDFPDNSVVCHARRAAMLGQDNFVSGAALGVHCGDLPLPFFPDIYNEDWFFFSKAVARHDLPSVGFATQTPYDPFANPDRARHEEFGDLLAEGLYSLIGDIGNPQLPYHRVLGCANDAYWEQFIGARHENLDVTRKKLEGFGAHRDGDGNADAALRSLAAAEQHLETIAPEVCTEFLAAWQDDLDEWERLCSWTSDVGSEREAMDHLGVLSWRRAEFGDAHLDGRYPTLFGLVRC